MGELTRLGHLSAWNIPLIGQYSGIVCTNRLNAYRSTIFKHLIHFNPHADRDVQHA
jgi:hypothetical protein